MIRSWINLTAVIVLAGVLTACQKTETINTREVVQAPNNLGKQTATHGTVDAGGGSGVGGKPLEAYHVPMASGPEFTDKISKIIEVIKPKIPRLAGDLIHVLRERVWYVVPAHLDALEAVQIGVNFKTDQIALQNLREIWIDKTLFAAMTDEDRQILVLHELVMGVRLLEFSGKYDLCVADLAVFLFDKRTQEQYDKGRSECGRWGEGSSITDGLGIGTSLSKDDYANIRKLTVNLFRQPESIDPQHMLKWLAKNHFRDYSGYQDGKAADVK